MKLPGESVVLDTRGTVSPRCFRRRGAASGSRSPKCPSMCATHSSRRRTNASTNTRAFDDILELYLNSVYLGRSSWGVELVARGYFGKSARALTLVEGALLAGLTKGPAAFSPDAQPARAQERLGYVLTRMQEEGMIGSSAGNEPRDKPELPAVDTLSAPRPSTSGGRASMILVLAEPMGMAARCCELLSQEPVMKTIFLIPVSFCLAVSGTSTVIGQGSFVSLAQAQTTAIPNTPDAQQTTPNALDAQDRIRARELERAHAEVRRRLGDRSPEPTIRRPEFTAPNTNTTNHQKP
jgi:hypothetical protein